MNTAQRLSQMFGKEIKLATDKNGPVQHRICRKCDEPRSYPEGYYVKGRGRDSVCKLCRDGERKARNKGKPKKKRAPWLNPNSLEGSPHGEFVGEYERVCGLVAIYHMLAMSEKDAARKKGLWAAYYKASEKRDVQRAELLRLLAV